MCDLDAISFHGLNSVFWSCHPVPVDHSGDCIRVLCWDELQFGACLACFGCSVLSIFWISDFIFGFCIKFTDLLLSVEFYLFLGLSL